MNKGFTLIDLVIFMALFGIILVFTFIFFNKEFGEEEKNRKIQVKECIKSKIEQENDNGSLVDFSKKVNIELHCNYLFEYK